MTRYAICDGGRGIIASYESDDAYTGLEQWFLRSGIGPAFYKDALEIRVVPDGVDPDASFPDVVFPEELGELVITVLDQTVYFPAPEPVVEVVVEEPSAPVRPKRVRKPAPERPSDAADFGLMLQACGLTRAAASELLRQSPSTIEKKIGGAVPMTEADFSLLQRIYDRLQRGRLEGLPECCRAMSTTIRRLRGAEAARLPPRNVRAPSKRKAAAAAVAKAAAKEKGK